MARRKPMFMAHTEIRVDQTISQIMKLVAGRGMKALPAPE